MHAASVHPEPGSNSRKNFISNTLGRLTSSRAIYLSFTFCLSSILNKLWRDQYLHLQCFVLLSCCSIFNDRCYPFLRTARLLYHNQNPLSIPFSKFFKNFFQASSNPSSRNPNSLACPLVRWACLLYYLKISLSRGFFKKRIEKRRFVK